MAASITFRQYFMGLAAIRRTSIGRTASRFDAAQGVAFRACRVNALVAASAGDVQRQP
jgi:hypothetical protein